MYCDDNDGRFPEAGDLGWKRGTWVIAFRDAYRTKSEMVLCPSAVKRRPTGTTGVQPWGDSTHSYIQGSGGIFNSQEVASYGGNNWTYYARDPSDERTYIPGRYVAGRRAMLSNQRKRLAESQFPTHQTPRF